VEAAGLLMYRMLLRNPGAVTVTYRLERIRALTGYSATDPAHWFTLEAAVLGARLLERDLAGASGSSTVERRCG
jgi:hypothetical protein